MKALNLKILEKIDDSKILKESVAITYPTRNKKKTFVELSC